MNPPDRDFNAYDDVAREAIADYYDSTPLPADVDRPTRVEAKRDAFWDDQEREDRSA